MTAQSLPAVVAVAVSAALCTILLKKTDPAMALLVSLAAGGLIFTTALWRLPPVFEFLLQFQGDAPSLFLPLIKSLGIGLLCQMGADLCADCGSRFLEKQVLFCGKICILLLGLPFLKEFFSLALELLEIGGGAG